MEKRSHAGGRRESYFPPWLLVSTWDVVGPSRSHAERGAGFCPPQGQLMRMLWQCRHHGLGSSMKSVLGAPAGAVPAHCHPHPHSCQHPGLWPPAEGGGQGGRLAGLGAMAKPQSRLAPERKERRCLAQGDPQHRPALVLGGPGGQEGSTGAGLPELESGSLLTGPAPAAGRFASLGSFFFPCETSQQT